VAVATSQGYAIVDYQQGISMATECLVVSAQIVEGGHAVDPYDYVTSFSFGWEYMDSAAGAWPAARAVSCRLVRN
jgi:hypothetical protein